MTDGFEPQIRARAWSRAGRGTVVVAAAAVLLLVTGIVAVLADSERSSDVETVADAAGAQASTEPERSTPPTSAGADTPEETTTTTTAAAPTSTTTAAAPARTGTVSEVVDPPDGAGCQRLRSQTAWVATATPEELAAAAGGRVDYVETVTNEGPGTCSMVFERCPAPGVLFTAEGEPAPGELHGCPAIGHAPTELAPGESRRDVFTAELFTRPGSYELRVPQHDGRIASLPIRLDEQVPACDAGTLTIQEQLHEAGVSRSGTTSAHLSLAAAQRSCTVRITETGLTLRSAGDPAAAERTFTDAAERWYTTDTDRTVAYATFGPIDLPPGEYEGVIAIHLASGEVLRTPARLLVN